MNHHVLLATLASALLGWSSAQAESELESLRTRVAEQERQIRLLEEKIVQLRADATPRESRALQTSNTSLVSAQPTPPAHPFSAFVEHYTVVAGDNLVRIGRQLGISTQALAKVNGLEASSIIHPGQKLKIPAAATTTATASASAASIAMPVAAAATPSTTHAVQAGETFYSIARQHGISVDRVMAANPDTQPAALRVGQKIRVPQTTSAPTPKAQTEPSPETQPAAQPTGTRRQVRTLMIDGDMSYGAFAAKHGTTPERLNQLNGLDLDARTVLAKGSELYVPAQP